MSDRAKEDLRQTELIKESWQESGEVYGYRKVHDDLREPGEPAGKHRVYRLMHLAKTRSQRGYNKPKARYGGKPAVVAPNMLDQHFDVDGLNQVWVTDITMIRTYEGWLYLGVVIDLFSRQVVGWSMQSRIHADLVLKALLTDVWRRKLPAGVVVHSDQGSQYTSSDWEKFLGEHHLVCSMSRRGNCLDNAVAESFFQ